MLDIEHLYFSYTGREPWLLEDISLHVPKEAYISIVGNNGSGKSTLLKLILGFLSPVKGTIPAAPGVWAMCPRCLPGTMPFPLPWQR